MIVDNFFLSIRLLLDLISEESETLHVCPIIISSPDLKSKQSLDASATEYLRGF